MRMNFMEELKRHLIVSVWFVNVPVCRMDLKERTNMTNMSIKTNGYFSRSELRTTSSTSHGNKRDEMDRKRGRWNRFKYENDNLHVLWIY